MTPKEKKVRRYGDGRAAVLAHADAIRAWLASGRTVRGYYDEHAGELAISYSQFARLTAGYIRANRPTPSKVQQRGTRNDSSHPNPEPPPQPPVPQAPKPGAIRQFHHAGDGSNTDSSDLY